MKPLRIWVELAALARSKGVAFRAGSTVMSGTPVLGTLVEGLAGTVLFGVRGLLNATANFILSQMTGGLSYPEALARAQVAALGFTGPGGTGNVAASVRPEVVSGDDPLLTVEGAANALVAGGRPVGQVTVIGPGAGPRLAGQGLERHHRGRRPGAWRA